MSPKILIVDPLTLLGRELARCIEDTPDLTVEVDYRHTSSDDEHQIAELGAEPALVPPVDDPEDLAGDSIVVAASDTETDRTDHLESLLIRHPEISFVDVGRLPRLAELTSPALGSTVFASEQRHLRVAHPALVTAALILKALRPLDPVRGSVAAVDPVSVHGREALEMLVHQAGRRLQGGDPDHLIAGHVLAFNQVAIEGDLLTEEAAELIPDTPLVVTRTMSGCFHGHVAHLSIELAEPIEDPELRDLLEAAPQLVVGEPPISLDMVADRDQVVLSTPRLSPDRRLVAMIAMIDGLRLGGALTAVEILRAMTVH
jgi:hypothetical protein